MFNGNVRFLKNGFHKEINSYDSFILDSNVVMKLRDLFYSPHKMNVSEVDYYIGLLEFFKDKDVVPGIAIQELSWDFEKFKIDFNKQTRLLNAIDTLFSYDESTILRIKAQQEFVGGMQPIKGGKKNFQSLASNIDANIFLVPSFCVMLKYHHVLRNYSDNKSRYLEICNFLMNTLKLVGGYELALITELLFSLNEDRTNAINSMLKIEIESNLLKGIWNSCWDIFFLRFITGFAANTLSNLPTQGIFNPILVTRDENLYRVGCSIENNSEVVLGDQVYPGIAGSFEYSNENTEIVLKMREVILGSSSDRVKAFDKMTEKQREDHWLKIIKNLEIELLKVT
ncbi:hypothetical protein [Paenibacillus sp. TC-CSREp1]|uniref:hypothetical protein n=1 Tax=Paenibacillus sp. TC-CSREp1 TaxID=3410089 RepID=UPI003CEA7CB7